MKKSKQFVILLIPFLIGLLTQNLNADKKDYDSWNVNVHFIIGHEDCANWESSKCKKIINWIKEEIAQAEALYNTKPKLKIKAKFFYKSKKGGQELNVIKFKSSKKHSKFMDDYFDNAAKSKTDGFMSMRVLVVKKFIIDTETIGGKSNFPHRVVPFSRKYGPTLVYSDYSTCSRPTRGNFAHELGHFFGLKHTFESYATSRCNKDYKKGKKGEGSSLKNGRINVMDYNRDPGGFPLPLYLNDCQEKRAAKQRRMYMTKKGEVNYKKLKGIL